MSDTVSAKLVKFIQDLKWENIPPHVQDRARDRFLDTVSTGVAGRDIDVSQVVRKSVAGNGTGPCTSWVDNVMRNAGDAALVNGTSSHSILYEDVSPTFSDHPGPMMVPVTLAVAEEMVAAGKKPTVRDVLTGIVIGYEIQAALGNAMARNVVDRALRTTSLFGTVAAAGAASKVYGLNPEQTAGAVNIGANFSFGILEGIILTGNEMYVQAGVAGRQGVLAARMGEAGVDTTMTTFDGTHGYFKCFGPLVNEFKIGDAWRIMDIWCKPYPVSGGKLRVVDATQAAWQAGVRPQNIKRVVGRFSPRTLAYPGADFTGPFTRFTQAQNSSQFCIAVGLVGRDVTAVETFTKGFADPEVMEFIKKVSVVGEESRAASKAEQIDVHFNDGSMKSFEVEWAEGRVGTVPKMIAKLHKLTRDFYPPGTVDDLAAAITGPVDRPISDVSAILRRRL